MNKKALGSILMLSSVLFITSASKQVKAHPRGARPKTTANRNTSTNTRQNQSPISSPSTESNKPLFLKSNLAIVTNPSSGGNVLT